MISVFRKLFADSWGPRSEQLARNALYLIAHRDDRSLLLMQQVLHDEALRRRLLDKPQDPVVRLFWEREFAAWSSSFRAEALSPLGNKLSALLTNPRLRATICAPHSKIDLGVVMHEQKIFVASLPKGKIGEDVTQALGALLVTGFELAAYARASVAPEDRRPFLLVVDEWAKFATDSFAGALEETRKYGLGLLLAAQGLWDLSPALAQSVLGNVGTLMTFRVGAKDAEVLAAEFAPELSATDLLQLGPHQIALMMMVRGRRTRPFTALTLPRRDVAVDTDRVALLRRLSRERYGLRREERVQSPTMPKTPKQLRLPLLKK
jgi:hypothetical protein